MHQRRTPSWWGARWDGLRGTTLESVNISPPTARMAPCGASRGGPFLRPTAGAGASATPSPLGGPEEGPRPTGRHTGRDRGRPRLAPTGRRRGSGSPPPPYAGEGSKVQQRLSQGVSGRAGQGGHPHLGGTGVSTHPSPQDQVLRRSFEAAPPSKVRRTAPAPAPTMGFPVAAVAAPLTTSLTVAPKPSTESAARSPTVVSVTSPVTGSVILTTFPSAAHPGRPTTRTTMAQEVRARATAVRKYPHLPHANVPLVEVIGLASRPWVAVTPPPWPSCVRSCRHTQSARARCRRSRPSTPSRSR